MAIASDEATPAVVVDAFRNALQQRGIQVVVLRAPALHARSSLPLVLGFSCSLPASLVLPLDTLNAASRMGTEMTLAKAEVRVSVPVSVLSLYVPCRGTRRTPLSTARKAETSTRNAILWGVV